MRLRLPWLRGDKTGLDVGFEKVAKKKNVLDLVPIERRGEFLRNWCHGYGIVAMVTKFLCFHREEIVSKEISSINGGPWVRVGFDGGGGD